MSGKQKVSITLDSDLVESLGELDESLSSQVNDAVRRVVDERRRQRHLRAFLDEMAAAEGPVDEDQVAAFLAMLR